MTRSTTTAAALPISRRMRHAFALWRARAEERRALAEMGHREWRDIGIGPGDAFAEARKPFWIA